MNAVPGPEPRFRLDRQRGGRNCQRRYLHGSPYGRQLLAGANAIKRFFSPLAHRRNKLERSYFGFIETFVS